LRYQSEPSAAARLRILVTVTLNPNQLRSHLEPIAKLDEVEEIMLVADSSWAPPISKLRVIVPPRILVRCLGRAGAKLVVCLAVALRRRPDWVVGFTIVPHGVTARVVAALVRTHSMYQMIGGATEWIGGGWISENSILGRLPRPVPALERCLISVIRGSTGIVVMGERARRDLLERGIPDDRIAVIPPAIHLRTGTAAVEQYDLLTVSRLTPNKRLEDILEAMARFDGGGRALRLGVAGVGDHEPLLRSRAAELGIAHLVDFLGFRDELASLYASSRVFVLASISEGLPIAMLEAMAMRVAPVVTHVGEIPTVIRDGHNGFLFAPGDVDALVDRLGRVLDDDVLRERMGTVARDDVLGFATVDAVSRRYADLFARHGGAKRCARSSTHGSRPSNGTVP
jgi:glycosyltransferase involved in cell wall biosynthesis